mgnify:FL=1
MKKWRIVLLCAVLVSVCAVSAVSGHARERRAFPDGPDHGKHPALAWSGMPAPEGDRAYFPVAVTLTGKVRDDLWTAADRSNRTVLMKVTLPNAAPSLEAGRPYVIAGFSQIHGTQGLNIFVVEGDSIRPLDVEDP